MDHFSLKLLVFGIVYNEVMNINFRVLSKIQIFIIIQDLGHTSLCFHNLLFSCKEVCQVILQLLEEWFRFFFDAFDCYLTFNAAAAIATTSFNFHSVS